MTQIPDVTSCICRCMTLQLFLYCFIAVCGACKTNLPVMPSSEQCCLHCPVDLRLSRDSHEAQRQYRCNPCSKPTSSRSMSESQQSRSMKGGMSYCFNRLFLYYTLISSHHSLLWVRSIMNDTLTQPLMSNSITSSFVTPLSRTFRRNTASFLAHAWYRVVAACPLIADL